MRYLVNTGAEAEKVRERCVVPLPGLNSLDFIRGGGGWELLPPSLGQAQISAIFPEICPRYFEFTVRAGAGAERVWERRVR